MSLEARTLVIPQWQGYAIGDGPAHGARSLAAALGTNHATIDVAQWNGVAGARDADVRWLPEITRHAADALRWLDETAPARLLVIGGDCGADFAPIAWQAKRFGDELGVLYLDAHGDCNTPVSSPSGRFHGMVLRAALGETTPALAALCPRPLAPAQIVMAGTRDLDPAEHQFLEAASIRQWPVGAIDDGRVLAAVLAHPARCWHVHFDLDVLDPDDFPDVTVPTPGGTTLAAVTRLLVELVGCREVVSVAVTEHVGGEASARRVAGAVAALRRTGWS